MEDIGGKGVGTSSKANSITTKSDSMIFRGSIMFCLKDTLADTKYESSFTQHIALMVQSAHQH